MATSTQPVGTPVDTDSRETHQHAIESSGPRGDNPATAGPGPSSVRFSTPENAEGQLNPSPEDSNTTPGTTPER